MSDAAWHIDQRRSRHGTRLSAWRTREPGVVDLCTAAGNAIGVYRDVYAQIMARAIITCEVRGEVSV